MTDYEMCIAKAVLAAMRCLVKSHRGDFIDLDVPEGA